MTREEPVLLRSRVRPSAPRAKVALVRAPVVMFPRSLSGHGPIPPIGLAYLAAVLRDAGHRVQVVDAPGEGIDQHEDFETDVGTFRRSGLTPEEVVARIDPDTQVVGITHMFLHEWPQVQEVAERVRAALPDATIVLGGENATAFYPWIFESCDAVDHVVLGEGELTALDLVERVAAGLPVDELASVVSRPAPGQAPREGTLPTRLRALDEVPRPAWDLFPIDAYLDHADYFGVARGRSMPVMATRGCPYRCSFCSSPQMWTTRYVVRDPDDVADEIAEAVERWDLQNIDFCDLTAITKRRWTLAFCDALEARSLDLTWQLPVGTRAEALDAEVLQRLWDTGCRNVTYAPESGSKRLLALWDKRVDLDHILTSIRHAHRLGLRTHANIIIGHPEERLGDLLRSWWYFVKLAKAGTDTASAIMFGAYPGSADFKALLEEGRLDVDEEFLYVGISRGSGSHRSYHPRWSSRRIHRVQMAMMLTFYGLSMLLHPGRLVQRVRAQLTGQEETHFDQLVRIKRRGVVPAARRLTNRRSSPSHPVPGAA